MEGPLKDVWKEVLKIKFTATEKRTILPSLQLLFEHAAADHALHAALEKEPKKLSQLLIDGKITGGQMIERSAALVDEMVELAAHCNRDIAKASMILQPVADRLEANAWKRALAKVRSGL